MRLNNINRPRLNSSVALLAVAALTSSCGRAMAAPTAPTSETTWPAPTPAPTPNPSGPVTLTGQVTEAPPTTLTQIGGAIVSIADGANAGRSATADVYGFYTLAGLAPGPANIAVTAADYVSASKVLQLTSDTTWNVQLMPSPRIETHTLSGDIAAGDGTCSDGIEEYACRIVVIPIHNGGALNATLNWTGTSAKLGVTLFQTGIAGPIARSTQSGPNQERVDAMLPGGADYEFRITFAAGTGSTTYVLRVTHMN